MRHRSGGAPDDSTRSSVAPVGVVASPSTGPPDASSSPSSRIAVAGAGTGNRACVASTHPCPTATPAVRLLGNLEIDLLAGDAGAAYVSNRNTHVPYAEPPWQLLEPRHGHAQRQEGP